MASTPKKSLLSPSKSKLRSQFSPIAPPVTPQSLPTRRSTRLSSLLTDSPKTPNLVDAFNETPKKWRRIGERTEPVAKSRLDFSRKDKIPTRNSLIKVENEKDSAQFLKKRNKKSESDEIPFAPQSPEQSKSVKRKRKVEGEKTIELSKKRNGKDESVKVSFAPTSPDQSETKKRKRKNEVEKTVITRARAARKEGKIAKVQYYKKVVYDGGEFEVGDDVYVKRRDDATSDEEDPEVEDCKLCFSSGDEIIIECDSCLGGFHLKCLTPPLKEVPEGDWICGICEGRKMGKDVDFPKPPEGKKIVRTMRQKLHSSDLWAARIESIWKEVDGSYWCRVRWYMIPEETSVGRQPHNLSRELYRTNDFANIEMESVLRHCSVMTPKEYAKASDEGDDVFLCEYEYDIRWHSFKRLADIDDERENSDDSDGDEDWNVDKEPDSDTDEDVEYEEENIKTTQSQPPTSHQLAANLHKGRFFGLQKIGAKRIPEHIRSHKQTNLERAKASLLLASLPKSLPCRNKEMDEITTFIKGAISDNQCLGRCLYIHGVPGTGKTMSVLSVMRSLRSEVDAGNIKPYCFVEINGLKLASPENIYKVIYEALNGHRVGWKEALRLLNERFVEGKKTGEEADRPCILLIDELDLLVTRNQSVLYNILDWPTKPHSKLIVIGIANTMDLPEKLLPRISSRMGIQRLCFAPYNYQQLQEIISSRLNGIDIFEKQAMEFASRKVAAISGDARRALEICRRAAEIADYRIKKLATNPDNVAAGKGLVCMADVEAAIQEMFQAPHIQVMKNCSRLSKIFLTAMVHELYKTGMGETTFEKLATTVSCICTSNGEVFPGYDILLQVGCKLGECRIILCEAGAKHRLQKLQLNFPSDDVTFSLRDCKDLPWLSKYLM
ncbi:cell division control protein B [Trifolium repens]|nr:cell division control protein B [Trifolium repens]